MMGVEPAATVEQLTEMLNAAGAGYYSKLPAVQ
jgi:hypothetical protein